MTSRSHRPHDIVVFGEPWTRIAMRVQAMKGGASGGTIVSIRADAGLAFDVL